MNLPTHGERGLIVRLPTVAANVEHRSRGRDGLVITSRDKRCQSEMKKRHSHELGRGQSAIPLNNGTPGAVVT
jgi:hypothetical protein